MRDWDPQRIHSYQPTDLPLVLRSVGEWNRDAGLCGYLHPGDVAHLMSNGLRGRQLDQHLYLYRDAGGQLLGLVVLYPARQHAFDVLVRPDQRGGEVESGLLAWAEQAVRHLLTADTPANAPADTPADAPWIGIDVMACDTARRMLVERHGFSAPGPAELHLTRRSLHVPIPQPALPAGFTVRPVAGEEEADAVGALHAAAFHSTWPTGEYLQTMRHPAFHIDRELVAVAPDGQLAAFLIYWVDPESQIGLFEPVGCHPDFQRQGITRALLYAGMRCMADHGLQAAWVAHETAELNPAAALYQSAGFALYQPITQYRKPL